MYVLDVVNNETGERFREYWFTRKAMARVKYLIDAEIPGTFHESQYEILFVNKCCKTWLAFKKCLTGYSEIISKGA